MNWFRLFDFAFSFVIVIIYNSTYIFLIIIHLFGILSWISMASWDFLYYILEC